jgi:hypothetical protein
MSSAATAQHSAIAMMSISAGSIGVSWRRSKPAGTPALGGHVEQCGDCGLVRCAYNTGTSRRCAEVPQSALSKCQGLARAEWLEARQAELLPVPYFHVVVTLPVPAAEIAFQNKRMVYASLFRAAAEAMRDVAAEPRHLGAEIGAVAVLHSWGQAMTYHPHLHCIVPAGGLSPDQTRWVACRPGFLLPVRVLSRRFREVFVARLRTAYAAGELRFSGALAALAVPTAFAERLASLLAVECRVGGDVAAPPSQTRTCRFPASGSSRERFARGSGVAVENLDRRQWVSSQQFVEAGPRDHALTSRRDNHLRQTRTT